ncbi:cytochrome P450 [Streptomyces sp. H10-C2]|uniref:cytochrome P450 n=1 Tax=unclassified Streptomyces TaxID=2593676 RepID=UPI0024BB575C|nr:MULTISPECIES: cytochrome P450 [unclassified Streptomyces]MDJ0343906.1 cytochrome P450 [Streptomyces sp. PH10-H1]MDJ0373347.1 cytochrome P450 [Streptomyces sp. H10-C2]
MSTPPTDDTHADSPLVPPPGCPAHALGADGRRRLYGPEADADPMALYEQLRKEHGSVAPVLLHGDVPAWLVLGHRENEEVARTPSRFSRDSRRWLELQQGRVPLDSPLLPIVAWQPMCSFVDGAEHQRLRAAVTQSMERFDGRGIRRYVNRFANQLVDTFCSDGHADLVTQFAGHLPMLVMTQVLGMSDDYGPRLVEAAQDMMKGSETAIASNDYLVKTLRELVARKRAEPGNDFASWLIGNSAALTDDEALEHLRLVLIAGYSTTANLIVNTLRMVLTDRRFRASLAGLQMTIPDALEQSLWDAPPFTTVYGRWATGDTELGGQHIRGGDMLVLCLAGGNVDPAVRPDLSVPMYGNRSHLAFSRGPHECPGQDLGRAIADTGIDALLTRLPDLTLAVDEDELSWTPTLLSRNLAALPVTFTPRKPAHAESLAQPAPVPAQAATRAEMPPAAPSIPPPPQHAPRLRTPWWRAPARWLRGR